jgi:uncharacterized membrane protein YphA (DoxX/SURF4 family)
MGIAIWVLQVLLGLFFVFHAYLLLWPSPERLQEGMGWVLEMPAGLRQFAGVAEGVAGVALVVAPLLHLWTWLTPLAAAGLVLLMLGAIVFHIPRREYPNVAFERSARRARGNRRLGPVWPLPLLAIPSFTEEVFRWLPGSSTPTTLRSSSQPSISA